MVIQTSSERLRQRGALMGELLVAMSLLVVALLPIAYSVKSERTLARSYYERAVAMEIVDGELETLRAGAWKQFPVGSHDYTVQANAVKNLTDGKFLLTIETNSIRLEWQPSEKHHGGTIAREVLIP